MEVTREGESESDIEIEEVQGILCEKRSGRQVQHQHFMLRDQKGGLNSKGGEGLETHD